MVDNIETISYINPGDGQNHPINAVTVNGQTIPDITGLPSVSNADNGKVLRVVNGQWTLVEPAIIFAGDGNTNFREFDLTITYNPLASGTKFTCFDNLNNKSIYTSSLTFPDIDELKYLKVTIGCALDQNGNPYRYSNINVRDFSIQRT